MAEILPVLIVSQEEYKGKKERKMFCISCGLKLSKEARFCPSCGSRVPSATASAVEAVPSSSSHNRSGGQDTPLTLPSLRPTPTPVSELKVQPCANKELRIKLLECYIEWQTSQDLSRWLQNLGQDPKGSVEEKKTRIREYTQYLSMPPETFPDQTLNYLRPLNRTDILSDICTELGLDCTGPKSVLFRRIFREAGCREGWLTPIKSTSAIDKQPVLQFVQWYPILTWSDYEKEYYDDFFDEMVEIFGEDNVHREVPIAHGSTLKIDFHIGHPQNGGVGVEFKLPTNNNELQRALGQMDQYLTRYGSDLIVVLIPHRLKSTDAVLFRETLHRKGIETVMKCQDFGLALERRAA